MEKSVKERFESKYRVNPETGCWDWTDSTVRGGYGQFNFIRKKPFAHRVSYELYKGPKTAGLNVNHTCDNTGCVNPEHLWLGTQAEGMKDKVAKGRQAKGSENGNSKLTKLQVEEIREFYATGSYTQRYMANMFSVDQSLISDIVTGKIWKHL